MVILFLCFFCECAFTIALCFDVIHGWHNDVILHTPPCRRYTIVTLVLRHQRRIQAEGGWAAALPQNFSAVSILFPHSNLGSSLCAFAINDDEADALSAVCPPLQNFWIRHCISCINMGLISVADPKILKGGGRQFISAVLSYNKCAQRNICLLHGKSGFKIWANRGRPPPPPLPPVLWIRHCLIYTWIMDFPSETAQRA